MSADWLVYLTAGIVAISGVVVAGRTVLTNRRAQLITRRDGVINVDQWTDERRKQLARLNRPAAKGLSSNRHSVIAWKDSSR